MNATTTNSIRTIGPPTAATPTGVAGTSGSHEVEIPQYGPAAILAIWAAAAVPMGVLAWLAAPALADRLSGEGDVPMAKALIICLGVGLAWQFVLVALLVRREQGTLRWAVVRPALWLRSPRSPRTGTTGGRVWLVLIPLILAFAAAGMLPAFPQPEGRDLGAFLESDTGQAFLDGSWLWFTIIAIQLLLNTVFGEELLFRGFLLPRMSGAFGRADWIVNGVLFAAYHLHVPWAMPAALLDTFLLAYPTKRYGSAWIGIAVHSAQTLFVGTLVLALVL